MRKVCLVANDIRSTHNVGSLFRSADGFSAELVLTGITPRPHGMPNDSRLPYISKKAHNAISKTALGAENSVPWRYFEDIITAIISLKSEGFVVCALEQDEKSKNLFELPKDKDLAIVLGTEVTGLTKQILELCDSIYEIPMTGSKESFNVSVAAGIALYQSRIAR